MTSLAVSPPSAPPAEGMAWVPGGTFAMGCEDFYPEERPVHQVKIEGLWMDTHPVTVAEFRRFVKATGHVTLAERAPDAADYPDADPALLVPGSLVFRPSRGPVDLSDHHNWWAYVPGACWRAPEGPGSDVYTRARIRSSTSPTRTRSRTPSGPARRCPRRRSGSAPRAAAWRARRSPGATSTFPADVRWRTPGRASSRGRT